MNRIAFILVPFVGISLWLGAATFTLVQLESMAKTTRTLRAAPVTESSPTLTAGR